MKNEILFAKLDEKAVIPSKREEDGAFDIYGIYDEDILIAPGQTIMIKTGLMSAFSEDYVAILKERGSTGTKGIGQRCGVIDSGYRGEWMIPVTNHNLKNLVIAAHPEDYESFDIIAYPQSKAITQCMMVEVPKLKIKEATIEELQNIKSERGAGKLGSTGK